jgi:predicted LPLAT superfamily acyltransferase
VTYYWLISRQARQAYLNRLAVYAPSLKLHGRHVIYFDHFSDMLKFPRKMREQAMQQVAFCA